MYIKTVDGAHERNVAVAHQLHNVHARPHVFAGDADDQSQIRADDRVLGVVGAVKVAFQFIQLSGPCKLRFELPTRLDKAKLMVVELKE